MVDNLLDPLREDWEIYCEEYGLGTPAIRVSSGIRSKLLNEKVGGSKTSAHYRGYAVDLVPYNGKLKEFKQFCMEWLENREFDQMISEEENKYGVPQWIHIGYKNGSDKQRKQYKYMVNGKYYMLK